MDKIVDGNVTDWGDFRKINGLKKVVISSLITFYERIGEKVYGNISVWNPTKIIALMIKLRMTIGKQTNLNNNI